MNLDFIHLKFEIVRDIQPGRCIIGSWVYTFGGVILKQLKGRRINCYVDLLLLP